jgi:hypothetical protein
LARLVARMLATDEQAARTSLAVLHQRPAASART